MIPKNRIIPIFLPFAGCPHRCVFCEQNRITGEDGMSPVRAGDMIERALAEVPDVRPELAYYGGSFTAMDENTQRVYLDIAARLYDAQKISGVRMSTRPDCVDMRTISLLSNYPVTAVELGAQSMDDRVLRLSERGHTAADTVHAAKLLQNAGIPVILQMMAGLPGDSREACVNTARALAELEPAGARIYPVAVFPGTKLHALWQSGDYTALTQDDAVDFCADAAEVFISANIPIIRIGLNAGEALDAAAAGARHPAMGELVRSRLYLRRARAALAAVSGVKRAELIVCFEHIPLMVGQKRENLLALEKECGIRLRVRAGDMAMWEVMARVWEN